jgi:two-component system response regulator (stage 0 sporulation protein F)
LFSLHQAKKRNEPDHIDYIADAIVQAGILNEAVNFIEKPFATALARKVREVLVAARPRIRVTRESIMASILLVEDDDQLRAMLKRLLTGEGYEVCEASNGAGVADMHEKQRFDLVITDLVMPNIEGLEVIMDLRRIDRAVRIIAMSGGGRTKAEDYLRIAQKLGVQLTLSKPFGNQEFLEAVRVVLETSAQNEQE